MHRDLTLHVKGSACKCTGKVAKIRGKKAKIGLESNFQDPHYTNHLETGLQFTCKLRCSFSLVGL